MLPIALGWKHGYIEVLPWLNELVTCTAWTGLRYSRELSWRRDSNLGRRRRRVVKSREVIGPLISSFLLPTPSLTIQLPPF